MADKFDYYVIQGNYGVNDWEDLTASEDLAEAKNERINYDRNEPHIPHRIQSVWKSGKRRTIVQD